MSGRRAELGNPRLTPPRRLGREIMGAACDRRAMSAAGRVIQTRPTVGRMRMLKASMTAQKSQSTVSIIVAVVMLLGTMGMATMIGCRPPVPCSTADDVSCQSGTFCKLAEGSCGDSEAAGVCADTPAFCTLLFSPVCGCDGVTYDNPCMADSAGVNIAQAGSCEDGRCCDPTTMPGEGVNPACVEGVSCCGDGVWRCNEGDGATTCDSPGTVCSEVCGGIAGVACSSVDAVCKTNVGERCCDIQGVCVEKPDFCTEIFAPVCGCDGMTYANDCFAASAGVNVDHAGECGG